MPPDRHARVKKIVRTDPIHDFVFKEPCLFDRLPIELNQKIGLEFHQIIDLQRFSSICRSTHNALESDKRAFWRRRFMKSFDSPDWTPEPNEAKNNTRFKLQYMQRQNVLCGATKYCGFASGFHKEEVESLKVLHTMVKEASFELSKSTGELVSRNIEGIESYVRMSGIYRLFDFDQLEDDARAYTASGGQNWHSLLLMLQCMLTPTILMGNHRDDTVLGFSISQAIVYASSLARPLFRGGAIDFDTLLHHVNFWKYHFLSDDTGAISGWYAGLAAKERPSFWNAKLSNINLGLSTKCKGTYAYLDDQNYFVYGPDGTFVNGQRNEDILQDNFLGNGEDYPFQDIELKMCDPNDHFWPEVFEYHLPITKPQARPLTRAQGRTYQEAAVITPPVPISACLAGQGNDQGDFFSMSGWLEQVPDQLGMPGWGRITLMKYYIDEVTRVMDYDSLWAYEGVVFAGGRIIVGRWWHPTPGVSARHAYRGPFILWVVDGDDEEEPGQAEK